MNKHIIATSIIFLTTLTSCATAEPALTNYQLYDNAVKDAVFVENDEIMQLLKRIKM